MTDDSQETFEAVCVNGPLEGHTVRAKRNRFSAFDGEDWATIIDEGKEHRLIPAPPITVTYRWVDPSDDVTVQTAVWRCSEDM